MLYNKCIEQDKRVDREIGWETCNSLGERWLWLNRFIYYIDLKYTYVDTHNDMKMDRVLSDDKDQIKQIAEWW